MKTIKLLTLLLSASLLSFGQEPKDSTVVANKTVVNREMIKRFNEAPFDSTKNFNYMLSHYLKSGGVKPEDE